MAHGVVLDPHLHLVATAINSDLGICLCRRKSRQTWESQRGETAPKRPRIAPDARPHP